MHWSLEPLQGVFPSFAPGHHVTSAVVNGPCNQNGRLTTASRMKLILPLRNGFAGGRASEIVVEDHAEKNR